MEPYLGQIMLFGGNFVIKGWAACDGSLVSIAQNQALFAILGTTYGGDGVTTFALPTIESLQASARVEHDGSADPGYQAGEARHLIAIQGIFPSRD